MSNEKFSDDYHSANESLIKRESQKFERAKAKAESLETSMTKGLAAALKEQRLKLRDEAGKAVTRAESGQLTDNERRMLEAAQKGIDNVRIDEGIITGFDQPSYLSSNDDDDF
jgi:hypothetical protein